MCQSMSELLHLGESITFVSLGMEHIQPALEVSSQLGISSVGVSSTSCVLVSGRTGHMSIETSNSHYTSLNGGSLAFHCRIGKDLIRQVQ